MPNLQSMQWLVLPTPKKTNEMWRSRIIKKMQRTRHQPNARRNKNPDIAWLSRPMTWQTMKNWRRNPSKLLCKKFFLLEKWSEENWMDTSFFFFSFFCLFFLSSEIVIADQERVWSINSSVSTCQQEAGRSSLLGWFWQQEESHESTDECRNGAHAEGWQVPSSKHLIQLSAYHWHYHLFVN